jgi:hypothetical protein
LRKTVRAIELVALMFSVSILVASAFGAVVFGGLLLRG